MKTCAGCDTELTKDNCYVKTGGYLRAYCKLCHNKKSEEYNKVSSKTLCRKENLNKRQRARRANPKYLSTIIWQDSRKSDKKHNRENDLTKDYIGNLIANGCQYCGEFLLRMTVDRIDNTLGHLQSNVVPACLRCNLARGDMPYEAWLCLVPGIKEAKSKGLFGNWIGRIKYRGIA